jgi:putative copper resistance protein D
VLLCKIALFAVLLALAAANRFVFLVRLRRPGGSTSLAALSRSVLLEQLGAVGIVALAAILGSLPPASCNAPPRRGPARRAPLCRQPEPFIMSVLPLGG